MQDEMVATGMYYRTSSLKEANTNNFRLFTGSLMPNIFKGGSILSNTSKVQQGEKVIQESKSVIELTKITFGKNSNQVYHAFRHTDEMGLAREAVESAVREHLPSIVSQIVEGKPLNQVIEVAGQKIQYTAYKLPDGTINIGRIHGATN